MLSHLRKQYLIKGIILSLFTLNLWLPVVAQAQQASPTLYTNLVYRHLPSLNS